MSKVVTLTFDANMAPAVRKFIEAKEAIKKVKDEAKGMTTAVGQTTEKTGQLANETEKFAKKQMNQIRNLVGSYLGLHSIISIGMSLIDTYNERQKKAVADSESFLKMVTQVQGVAGGTGSAAIAAIQDQAIQLGVTPEFSKNVRLGVETAGRGLGEGRKSTLANIGARLGRVRGATEGQAGAYGSLAATSGKLFDQNSDAEISDALVILSGVMGPDEAERYLREAVESGANLNEAVSLAVTASETKAGTGSLGEILRGVQAGTKSRRLSGSFSSRIQQIGVLSDRQREKIGASGVSVNQARFTQIMQQNQGAIGGAVDDLAQAEYVRTSGAEGALIAESDYQQRVKNAQALKTAQEYRATVAKETTDIILSDPRRFGGLPSGPAPAPALRNAPAPPTNAELVDEIRLQAKRQKDAVTNDQRTTGGP